MHAETGASGATAASWRRLDSAICLASVAAFVASRVAWIAIHPRSSQYWEEGYRWLAVQELLSGAPLSLFDYQADHYQGGSLVVIALAAALAKLGLGAFAALKVVAVGLSAATCAALFAVGRCAFGRGEAVLCAAIYLLGPPLVAYWGVVAMGFHAESALFSLLAILCFLRLVRSGPQPRLLWLAAGVVAGFGIWFAPIAALAMLACALTWPLLAPRPRATELAVLSLGLLLGFAPWLAYNVTHEFAGVMRAFEVFGVEGAADAWRSQGLLARMGDLLGRGPVEGLLDPGGDAAGRGWLVVAQAAVWLPAGLALAAAARRWLGTLRRGPRRAPAALGNELVFPIHALLFALAYLGSRFTFPQDPSPIGYRLLVPLAVLLIPPIAVSAARGMRSGSLHATAARAACAAALLALAVTTLAFARSHEAEGTPLDAERAEIAWGHILQRKHSHDLERALEIARSLPAPRRERVLLGIGWGIESAQEQLGSVAGLEHALAPLPPDERRRIEQGIRYWVELRRGPLAERLAQRDDPDLRATLARLESLSDALRPPSVVLITLDTTRADHLSCYGYARPTTPRLDAFAKRAVRFERAWSTSSWTLPAHASLFTGMYPSRHGAHYGATGMAALGDVLPMPVARHVRAGRLAERFVTIADLLSEHGYRTAAFVAGPWLHRSFGLLQGFQQRDDEVHSFGGRPAREITARARSWLAGIRGDQPYLLFANYFDPHAPYEPVGHHPEFPRASEPLRYDYDALMRGEAGFDAETRAVLRDRYDAEIRDMDEQLGALLDAVLARPDADRTLIVVTADHGESLGEGGRLGHGFWLDEVLTRVPLLVRYPGDRDAGTRRAEPIQLVDVLPLVADELGLPLPEGVEGVVPGARTVAYAELYREITTVLRFGASYDRDLTSVVRWPDKLERASDGRERLLRLSPDDLVEREQDDAVLSSALRELIEAHEQHGPGAPVLTPQHVDPETVEALRALGYVE